MRPSTITILGCERGDLGLFSQSVCCCVLSSVDLEELGLKDGCGVGVNLRKRFDSPLGRVFLLLLMKKMHQLLGI